MENLAELMQRLLEIQSGGRQSRICYVLSLLRIHSPDCEQCNARQTSGDEIRKRLEELAWRSQPEPRSLKDGDYGVVVEAPDSRLSKL